MNGNKKWQIAGFVIEFKVQYSFLQKQCREYECDGQLPTEIEIVSTKEEVEQEYQENRRQYSRGYIESICVYRKLCLLLPKYDAILLHASVISICGRGIAFLAPSGVGKTTHTMLWKEQYQEAVLVINGDKPIVRFQGGELYAYGTPWAGKEHLQINSRVRLTDLCFLERRDKNVVSRIAKRDCIEPLLLQMLHPDEPEASLKTLGLANILLEKCQTWKICCNMNPEAAQKAYDVILGEK